MGHSPKTDIDMTLVYLVGFFGCLFIYVTVILAQTYYYHVDQQAYNERVLTKKYFELEHYKTESNAVLHSYGWVDREKGTIRIPIEEAIKVTAKEYEAGTYPNYEAVLSDTTSGTSGN